MKRGSKRSLVVKKASSTKPPKKRAAKKTPAKKVAAKKITLKRAATKKAAKKSTTTSKLLKKSDLGTLKRSPLGHLLIEQQLHEAGFRGGISTDTTLLNEYSTDESIFSIKPQVVLQPRNEKDIQTAIAVLNKNTEQFPSLSLTPRAAGTGLSGGSLTDSIVIDTKKHLHVIGDVAKTKDGATISCQPGAMWRDVEKALAAHDVYIPSFPASKDICTIGGAVANNSAGPDSLRYGHTASWIASLDIALHDGNIYTVAPMSYKELKTLIKKKHAYATIVKEIFTLIEKNEKTITSAKPKTAKNSAGYALWDVLDTSVASFKRGKGTFDLTQLICGSQGTIGIITALTMKAIPIVADTTLVAVPLFNLAEAGAVVQKALTYDPINLEVFDGLSFDLALQNPDFFKDRLSGAQYYRVLLSLYTTYHVRYRRKTPEFTLLITVGAIADSDKKKLVRDLKAAGGTAARAIINPVEAEMLWQIRRASYSLSKLEDPNKRPAAFLEDMTVPPKNLAKFFQAIKKLLKKYNVTAAVHGHGGNGHFHFYPLLDFRSQATPVLVEKMSEEFFATAIKYDGNICGEHNDGIIRTPHLSKMFNQKTLDLFAAVEHIFDPQDIFNPGKKVNPRFDIKETLRKTN